MRRGVIDELLPAVVGGLLAIALALIIRSAAGTRLLSEIVLDASSFGLQPRGFSFLLGIFGGAAKPLLFISVLLGKLAFYVITWRLISQRLSSRVGVTRIAGTALAISAGVLLLFSAILIFATPADLGSRTTWPAYAGVTLLTSAVYALVTGLFVALSTPLEYETLAGRAAARRAVMLRLPALLLGAIASVVIVRRLVDTTGGGAPRSHFGRETPEITPVEEFYVVSKNLLDPGIDAGRWELRVRGSVGKELRLKYDDIKALPAVREYATLQCISNDVGGDLIGNALWTGVPLRTLIGQAGPKAEVSHVIFRCEDDYMESLPLERAMLPEVLLAYEMNGQPLTQKHGYPLRLLAPGKYGMRNPKWITEIILSHADRPGYWVERGWSSDAEMNTSSRIDIPAPGDVVTPGLRRVHGVSFSGKRGISKVEVSTDGGSSWDEARLKPPLSPYTWVLWHYDWQVPNARETQESVLARATDGGGELQTSVETPAYPDGATGYPRVPVFLRPQA